MRIVLRSQNYWFPLLGALFFFLIGAGASLAVYLTDYSSMRDEAPLPFLMTSVVAVVILVGGFMVNSLRGMSERAAINALVRSAWTVYRQYDFAGDWRAFAENDYAEAMKKLRFPWLSLLAVVMIFTLVTGWTFALAGADGANLLVVALPLGAFFTFVLILLLGGVIANRNKVRALYHRRLRSDVPVVYVGKQGLYSEDTGYRAFRTWGARLINVYFQEGSPSTLNFQISIDVRYGSYVETVSVRVPAGKDSEADAIAHRYFDEGVVRR